MHLAAKLPSPAAVGESRGISVASAGRGPNPAILALLIGRRFFPPPVKDPMIRFLSFAFLLCSAPALQAGDTAARNFHIPALYHVGFWVRDIAKSRAFYSIYLGFEEAYDLNYPNGTLQLAVMKVNRRQVIYLFPNAAKILPNGDNLDHLGLETDDAAAMHDYLVARGLKLGPAHRGRIGDLILTVKDPDGHFFEVTQFEPEGQLLQHQGKSLPSARISSHLRSAAISVTDLAASLRFYRDLLGFKVVGPAMASRTGSTWLQVPDGTDLIELRPYHKPPGESAPRAVPDYCLTVSNAARASEILNTRAASGGFPAPIIEGAGAAGSPQTSVLDPDGTRVILGQ
jgi:catechol 2,3-dioxygenase-like lactoylglutathione lyase family enzyme